MNSLTELGAIFSIIGIPSIFALVIYLHRKHIEIMAERIKLLEEDKKRLEIATSDNLMTLLVKRKTEFDIILGDLMESKEITEHELKERVEDLNKQMFALQRDNEILELMSDGGRGAKSLRDEHQT